MIVVAGQDKLVADWMSKKWGHSIPPWYFALGIMDSTGLLKGGASFHNYNGSNVEIAYYGPNTFTKEVVRGLADFCINGLKIQRVTVTVPRKNKALLRVLPRLGFSLEGVMRHYYGPFRRDDGILFGMLAEKGKRFLR